MGVRVAYTAGRGSPVSCVRSARANRSGALSRSCRKVPRAVPGALPDVAPPGHHPATEQLYQLLAAPPPARSPS